MFTDGIQLLAEFGLTAWLVLVILAVLNVIVEAIKLV